MEAKVLKRLYKEIDDVNTEFFNLRTVIKPDPNDDLTRFTFIMVPNDGAMAHLTLVGAFYIHDAYPASPPVVHLYTKTGRYNVDVYHGKAQRNDRSASSLCFNILRAKMYDGPDAGTWTPDCTLSALFATLMSAIVSFYVPQYQGHEKPEYVSMDKLRTVKLEAKQSYEKHKHALPPVPEVPLVPATRVPAKALVFPREIISQGHSGAGEPKAETVTAGPIFLQTGAAGAGAVHTFAVDLSELHEGVVFSVILSNALNDHAGKKPATVLVRNGVTATAARKRAGQPTTWFYHGKPMNDGDMRLHVTVGADQMTMAYYALDGCCYVLGDCPVSRLTTSEIGDVRGVPFWLHIYTRNRGVRPATIRVLDTGGVGYVHRDPEDREFEFVDWPEKGKEEEKEEGEEETETKEEEKEEEEEEEEKEKPNNSIVGLADEGYVRLGGPRDEAADRKRGMDRMIDAFRQANLR